MSDYYNFYTLRSTFLKFVGASKKIKLTMAMPFSTFNVVYDSVLTQDVP